jgi:hypothetical protein
MITIALEEAVSNKYISKLEIENNTTKGSQIVYKYIE